MVTDTSWKTAANEQIGWTTATFDDSTWVNAFAQHDYFYDAADHTHLAIWGTPEGTPSSVSYIRKSFSLPSVPDSANFTIGVDDDYEIYVNGTLVGFDLNGYAGPWATYSVAEFLHAGANVIAVKGINTGGNHFFDGWLEVNSALTTEVSLSPASLTFASQTIGTSSSA